MQGGRRVHAGCRPTCIVQYVGYMQSGCTGICKVANGCMQGANATCVGSMQYRYAGWVKGACRLYMQRV